jgi:methylated-DNA-[protein]-cysteine S-methyltransferase
MAQISMHSPVGDITISEDDGEIVSLDWGWGRDQTPTPLLERARQQLEDYFDTGTNSFDLPLSPEGTAFQKSVWAEMQKIPAGSTKTYGDIAKILSSAARAVGMACGANPIPIIIPCHRILGTNTLGGYSGSGGVETKVALLRLERALL